MAGLALAGEVAVVSDGGGVAQALVGALEARGLKARATGAVDAARFGEGRPAVVFLGGLAGGLDDRDALAVARAAFDAAQAIAPLAAERGGIFVTVQDTGGDFGLSGSDRAVLGALAGLAKTAQLEWPRATVKAIDLERGSRSAEALAAAIADELFHGGGEIEVGLHADGRRTTVQSVPAPLAPGRIPLDERSVVVCSGGGRGVTAATLIALARQTRARIAVLGRTRLADEPAACAGAVDEAAIKRALLLDAKAGGRAITPAELGREAARVLAVREIRATLAALAEAGSPARYLPVDVSDAAAVAAALDEVRAAWGPITAVVHGAGVVADKLIADKTPEQLERVIGAKVGGLFALLDATSSDPLEALVLFSSVAARTGNVGQSDYAMANEILNKVACREARRRPEARVTSLNWGPWEAGMVTPSLKRYFEEHGVPLIGLDAGARMLCDELGHGLEARGSVEVVLGGPPRRAAIAGELAGELRFDVRVDAQSHPYLADHAIDGTPVLPMVMVLEWFARAAGALVASEQGPHQVVTACRDVRVFRGVVLERFAEGQWLRVIARAISPREIEAVLCDPADERVRRYAAIVELSSAPTEEKVQPAPLSLTPLSVPIYGDALFHGPAFQVIQHVEGVGEAGIAGELVGAAAQSWRAEPWRTDPAALDGGLQLAVLWAQHRLGGRGLPTALGALRLHHPGAVEGPLRCTVVGRTEGDSKAVSDITLSDRAGRLVARLERVETHQRP